MPTTASEPFFGEADDELIRSLRQAKSHQSGRPKNESDLELTSTQTAAYTSASGSSARTASWISSRLPRTSISI